MPEKHNITFHGTESPEGLAAKLNELARWLTTDPSFDKARFGDSAKIEHDGKATVTAFKMATGAAADKVLTSDADGDGTWETIEAGQDPGGNDTEVQFNDAGSFGGDSVLTYDKGSDLLTVPHLTITGELAGGRALITAGSTGTGKTGDVYLIVNGVITSANNGLPLARDGKIVSIYAMANIASYSGSVSLDAEVRINGSADTAYAPLDVSGTGWTIWGKTIARAEAASFSAADFMALMIDKGGAGTVSYGNVLMAVGIQMDT